MRPLLPVLAFAVVALAGAGAPLPAVAAPHEFHTCPSNAQGSVSHNGAADWYATTQSSRVLDLRVSAVGSTAALVCVYHMFGGEYWIYKRPSAAYPNCTVTTSGDGRRGFYCVS